MRILEIGCGTGKAERGIASRLEDVFTLAIERSEKAIRQAKEASQPEVGQGKLDFRVARIEEFGLPLGQGKFDLVFAIRVGALDGRHPELESAARKQISKVLKVGGRLLIDGGEPLKELLVEQDLFGDLPLSCFSRSS